MTKEGRLKRGKENYEAGVFLDNPETLEYVESLNGKPILKPVEKEEPNSKPKPKEK